MTINYETGKLALDSLIADAIERDQKLDRNEAQTRFDLIDRLLRNCLGWSQAEIRVEVHSEREYTDYELGSPGPRVVVEAKREGVYFELPAGWSDRVAALRTLAEANPGIDAAIRQALGYASSRGIQFAVVTNGWQIIAFIASRTDGIRPMDGRALVYPSLDSLASDFRAAWDALSQPGIEAQNLLHLLAKPVPRVVAPRLSGKIPGYPAIAQRTETQQTMQVLGGLFVEDVASLEENERHFLLSCYAASGALSQYASVSKEILKTRYSLLFDEEASYSLRPASSHVGLDSELAGDMAAASVKHRPIILLGDVGVGKSTFIRNLIHVAAREQLEEAIVLYLDFGKRPSISDDLGHHVAAEIKRQLQDDYDTDVMSDTFVRGVYHGKLEQFRSSFYGTLRESDPDEFLRQEIRLLSDLTSDADEHLRESLDHVARARRKQIVIFLDNIDQREVSFQDELFVIGQTMAESWPVTVFLALRPETFYTSKRTGSLSAYQPRAFSIAPPRVEVVLKKRLAYALERLRDGGLRTGAGVEIDVDLTTLTSYLQAIDSSLRRSDDILEFLENISNGNVRDALGYLEAYIGSPHVNLNKVLRIIADEGPRRYLVPLHDLVKSVMLQDFQSYDPSRSPIGNMFDARGSGPAHHFLMPMLVAFLADAESQGADGYVETAELFRFAQGMGFEIEEVAAALTRGVQCRFMTHSGLDRLDQSTTRAYRVSPCGGYVLQKLMRTFTYVDAVIVDTPIYDADFASTLRPMPATRELDARLKRAERFVSYLSESWVALPGASGSVFSWPAAAAEIRSEIRVVRDRMAETGSGRKRTD